MRSPITTHVLDTARGIPAAGLSVTLERQESSGWATLAAEYTDGDGRVQGLLPVDTSLVSGIYRLTFDTGAYFAALGGMVFYPLVQVSFTVQNTVQSYHLPLLLSPFGYSTYRGS